jgi:hypothetical protein
MSAGDPPLGGVGAWRARLRNLPSTRDLYRFGRALVAPGRRTAVRALVDGVRVTWILRRHGVRPLLAHSVDGPRVRDVPRAVEVSETVDVALAMLPVANTCLRRSLVLLRELRRLRVAGALHVGVRHVAVRPEAHAWIEVDGEVINDDPRLVSTYTELATGELERLLPVRR